MMKTIKYPYVFLILIIGMGFNACRTERGTISLVDYVNPIIGSGGPILSNSKL
ncbi:MAG: hypothetical protein MUC93_13795 [Bacteroidales bacterium]|jgi:hypothetical protein|nr:hypothetical protein [Bacteroidales bacterium]